MNRSLTIYTRLSGPDFRAPDTVKSEFVLRQGASEPYLLFGFYVKGESKPVAEVQAWNSENMGFREQLKQIEPGELLKKIEATFSETQLKIMFAELGELNKAWKASRQKLQIQHLRPAGQQPQ